MALVTAHEPVGRFIDPFVERADETILRSNELAGQPTRFLPFNLGDHGTAGNPPNPNGHRTAYLWERVWARDAWMDLLARFIHVERPTKGSAAAKKAAELSSAAPGGEAGLKIAAKALPDNSLDPIREHPRFKAFHARVSARLASEPG